MEEVVSEAAYVNVTKVRVKKVTNRFFIFIYPQNKIIDLYTKFIPKIKLSKSKNVKIMKIFSYKLNI